MEGDPAPLFAVLAEAGLLAQLLPELGLAFEDGLPANDAARILVRSLECAAAERLALAPRFALLALRALPPETVSALAERLRAPGDCRDLAVLAQRHAVALLRAPSLDAAARLELLERCDAFRRPERFDALLALLACAERGRRGWGTVPFPPRTVLGRALAAASRVDAGAVAAQGSKPDVAARVRRARVAAIGGAL
jgi:tRNA nucleotidyltransferase (CCA-adding enzyme)